jgi:hypothetical protein
MSVQCILEALFATGRSPLAGALRGPKTNVAYGEGTANRFYYDVKSLTWQFSLWRLSNLASV